jgi:hypothetical protein
MGEVHGVVQGGGVAEFQGLNSVGLQAVVQGAVACRGVGSGSPARDFKYGFRFGTFVGIRCHSYESSYQTSGYAADTLSCQLTSQRIITLRPLQKPLQPFPAENEDPNRHEGFVAEHAEAA